MSDNYFKNGVTSASQGGCGMRLYLRTSDGSLEDDEGNVIFFSVERFTREICEEGHCFLCGAHPKSKVFNDEHIIPRWVLKSFNLYDKSITLPNESKIRYDQYTVPCCQECNSFLGRFFEQEIRIAVLGGLESVNRYIKENGHLKIFLWLSLIFFKTHLKDSYLRRHRDLRLGQETIASDYDWPLMHHIHCMVRAVQSGASIEEDCLGSTAVLPATLADHYDNFDYRDTYAANTVLLRVADVAFVAVLDDSCAALNLFSDHFRRITGALSPIQLREVLTHLTLLNIKLKYRPRYLTKLDPRSGRVTICAILPETLEIKEHTREEFGEILYANVSEYVAKIRSPDPHFNAKNVRSGNYHFLFDERGKFLTNSMERIEMDE